MAQKLINQGPGNLIPDRTHRLFLCSAAIAKGVFVCLTGATGYTIVTGNAGGTLAPIGVAVEAGADGQWINVCVRGYCDYLTNDDTNQAEGDFLYSGANGTANTGVRGTADAGTASNMAGGTFGVTLAVVTSTTGTNVLVMPGII